LATLNRCKATAHGPAGFSLGPGIIQCYIHKPSSGSQTLASAEHLNTARERRDPLNQRSPTGGPWTTGGLRENSGSSQKNLNVIRNIILLT